jgi:hypothetical protein
MARKKRVRKVFITVLSSPDGATEVNTLGTRNDVRHWVTVENLAGYPADIDCAGRIHSSHPVIEFFSPQVGDTVRRWDRSIKKLADGAIHHFNQVTLRPASKASVGSEMISAEVSVVVPQSGRNGSATLDISVTAK